MSHIKEHPNLSPLLKLHILNLEATHNIKPHQEQEFALKRVDLLAKTRMFDRLLKQVEALPNLQFPSLNEKITLAKQKTAEQKKALGEDNLRRIVSDLHRKSMNDDDSEEVDAGQMNLYRLAKIYFDEGLFEKSQDLLYQLEKQALKDNLWIRVPWARLYNEVLLKRDEAKKTLDIVKRRFDQIENQEYKSASKSKKQTAQLVKSNYAQKEELLIVATVALFHKARDEDLQKYVDLCNEKSCFSVIQLLCPWLLRYISAACIVNKNLQKNRNYSFDFYKLTQVVKRQVVNYKDPFTQFIANLYVNFDFEAAAQNIKDLEASIAKDVILLPLKQRIVENCQFLYFKVYCKIYQSVSIAKIGQFIGKSDLQAQIWILKYIRSLDIEAKIDSVEGKVLSMRNKQNRGQKYITAIPNINTLLSTISHSQMQQD